MGAKNLSFGWWVVVIPVAFFCLLCVPACSREGSPDSSSQLRAVPTMTRLIASGTRSTLGAAEIMAQLTPGASLERAVEQLAIVLETTTDTIRVRVYAPTDPGACYDCDTHPTDWGEPETEGVPLNDVLQPIAHGSAVWLTAQSVSCHYSYNGTTFTPRFCTSGW
jgi:hypothetical protein